MKHNLRISVSKDPQTGGIVQCHSITLREKRSQDFWDRKAV